MQTKVIVFWVLVDEYTGIHIPVMNMSKGMGTALALPVTTWVTDNYTQTVWVRVTLGKSIPMYRMKRQDDSMRLVVVSRNYRSRILNGTPDLAFQLILIRKLECT